MANQFVIKNGLKVQSGGINVTGSLTLSDDLVVQGSITAQSYIVSSSVTHMTTSFSSGSTIFGDDSGDTHEFTGSVSISSTLNLDSVVNAGTDTNKFLVLDSNDNVDFRTGAELRSDIDLGATDVPTFSGAAFSGLTNANTDTDKFLVLNSSNIVKFRTGAEIASDIGALTTDPTLDEVTDAGSTTTNTISVGGITVTSMPSGVDNSVVVLDSDNTLKTDEIDSRVWGSTLVDASNGSNNRLATFSDSNSLNGESKLLFNSSKLRVLSSNADTAGIEIYGGVNGSSSPYITPSGSHTVLQFGSSETGLSFDVRRNKLAFDSDSTNTYIQADSSSPENLEIHADQNIELRADGKTEVYSTLELNTVVNAGADTDKFLVLDSNNNVDFRTGAEVLSDIGAAGSTLTLQNVTDNGNTTTGVINMANFTISSPTNNNAGSDKILVLDGSNRSKIRTRDQLRDDIGALQASKTPQMVVTAAEVLDGATTDVYIPFSGINIFPETNDVAYTRFHAPYDGYIKEIIVHPHESATSGNCTITPTIDGTATTGVQASISGTSGTSTTFSFGTSGYSFSDGDDIVLAFDREASNRSKGFSFTIVFIMDTAS